MAYKDPLLPADYITLAYRECSPTEAMKILSKASFRFPKSAALRHAMSRIQTHRLGHQDRCKLWGPTQAPRDISATYAVNETLTWSLSRDLLAVRKFHGSRFVPQLSWLNCMRREPHEHYTIHELRRRATLSAQIIQKTWWKHNDARIHAAIEIQRIYRAHCLRQAMVRKNMVETRHLGPFQALFRGFRWRMTLRKRHQKAMEGQRIIRGHQARRLIYRLRLTLRYQFHQATATRLQAWFRTCIARREFQRAVRAFVTLQARSRQHAARHLYHFVLRCILRLQTSSSFLLSSLFSSSSVPPPTSFTASKLSIALYMEKIRISIVKHLLEYQ